MIRAPFAYFGSKVRFYKEIKKLFQDSGKKKFADLFAGSLSVALSIKDDFKDVQVLANVKDKRIESLINYKDVPGFYAEIVKLLGVKEHESSRDIYEKQPERFRELKPYFAKLFGRVACSECGKTYIDSSLIRFSEDELNILSLLFSVNGKSQSLSDSFYSPAKLQKLKKFCESLKTIDITFQLFDENANYRDSFIFLDPPYISKTLKDEENFIGYNYVFNRDKTAWNRKDDARLISFVESNLNKGNVFLLFGSMNNNLQKLLKERFSNLEFITKDFIHSTFGKHSPRREWFCKIER